LASVRFAGGGFSFFRHTYNDQMKPWLWFILAIAVSAISWCYSHRILIPWDFHGNQQRNGLKQDMGDLYPPWVGTRELLLHGKNPYGTEVRHEIQMGFYGRPIEQTYNQPQQMIINEQRFAYPVYVAFLLSPIARADFVTVNVWAPVMLAALTTISIWLWLDLVPWQPVFLSIVSIILLILSSPQLAQGLRLRQLGLFVAFVVTFASWCAVRERYFIAGVLLAVATIKPQMVVLCVAWFLIWMTGEWQKRWPLGLGFAMSLSALAGAGEILVPGWPRNFIEGIAAYSKYFPTTSLLRVLLGNWTGWAFSIVLLVAVFAYGWHKRNVTAKSTEFIRVLALFFVASGLALPLLTPYNQVLLLLPLVVILRDWSALSRAGRVAFMVLVAWQPVTALALLIHPPRLDSPTPWPLLPSATVLFLPFLVAFLFIRREQAQ
jgi:hypothetical protein